MASVLLQYASGKDTPLLELSSLSYSTYCDKFGIEYEREHTVDLRSRGPNWAKILLILEKLNQGYEHIFWMDADTLIVDHSTDIRSVAQPGKIGMVRHPASWRELDYHYNSGVIFLHAATTDQREQYIDFFRHAYEIGPGRQSNGNIWQDQAGMLDAWLTGNYGEIMYRLPDRYNATLYVNDVRNPVIRACHGRRPEEALAFMQKHLKRLRFRTELRSVFGLD